MRSPAALVASLVCLASAFALAGLLVHDGSSDAETLATAEEGDALRLRGELGAFHAGGDDWAAIRPYLQDTTYVLGLEDGDATVLVTGLPADLDPATVVVEGTIVLETAHPTMTDRPLFVLLVSEVDEPFVLE